MNTDEKYMQRCIQLASLGIRETSPNPMVGCVIVCDGKIIGEGYHEKYGEAHAEVNAINSVKDQELLKKSDLYVSLEPCSHFGKTPPCSELIISKEIPNVIIGTKDPYAKVSGNGIKNLKNAGINIKVGVLKDQCHELNKRFFTFHSKTRPYVILKWAQTLDGFIDINRNALNFGEPTWITGELALRFVHKFRSEEDAIMVGTVTAVKDNPSLTVYNWTGPNPVRIVLDSSLRLSKNLKLLDNSTKTIIFNSIKSKTENNIDFVKIDFMNNINSQILNELYLRKIQSVIIEGGKQLLESFINANLWDEAFLFIGNKLFRDGIKAPEINGDLISEIPFESDWLKIIKNRS